MSGSEITRFPDVYRRSVKKISSYPSESEAESYIENVEKFIEYIQDSRKLIWVGTGRQEEMADFATRLTKANDMNVSCSKDSSIHYEYEADDLIVALSSLGETERTIHYAESAYQRTGHPAPIVTITSTPNSSLGQIAEKTGGFVVETPGKSKTDTSEYQEKQFLGKHKPLTLSGTLGELYALEFILDAIGVLASDSSVMEHHENFWRKVESYEPDLEQFRGIYRMLPDPVNYEKIDEVESFNKTVVCGLGLSGVIGRAFAIRLAHCADENKERHVNFYKDASNVASREGDLAIVFSGSGQKFWVRALGPVKERGGKIVGITSFPGSPLGDVADLCLEIPGRKGRRDESKLEHPPKTPSEALFEIRAFLAMETFIHLLVKKDEISVRAVENRHPRIT